MVRFLCGLAVIPALLVGRELVRSVPTFWAASHRAVRRHMVKRLPYPDPQWRAPLVRARYAVGIALLRPFLDRCWRYYRDLHDLDPGNDFALHQYFAFDDIRTFRWDFGFGYVEGPVAYLWNQGWPRFRLFRWLP